MRTFCNRTRRRACSRTQYRHTLRACYILRTTVVNPGYTTKIHLLISFFLVARQHSCERSAIEPAAGCAPGYKYRHTLFRIYYSLSTTFAAAIRQLHHRLLLFLFSVAGQYPRQCTAIEPTTARAPRHRRAAWHAGKLTRRVRVRVNPNPMIVCVCARARARACVCVCYS